MQSQRIRMENVVTPAMQVLYGQPEHLSTSYQTEQLLQAASAYFEVTGRHFARKDTGRYMTQLGRVWTNMVEPIFHQSASNYLFYANDGFADLRRWKKNHRVVYWMDAPWDYAAQPPTWRQWKDRLRYENIRCADTILAVSDIQVKTAQKLRLGREDSVFYLPVGVDCRHYCPENGQVEDIRRIYRLPDCPVIGYLGYLGMVDGRMAAQILIEAAAAVVRQCKVHFLIVGFGPAFEPLKKLVQTARLESNFTFTGYIPPRRLPSFIAGMDICIDTLEPGFHSEARSETKLKQYMAMGRACVATAIGENCVDLDQGACGNLIEPGVMPLSEAIVKLASQPEKRTEFGRLSRARALAVYDWPVLAKKMADVLLS